MRAARPLIVLRRRDRLREIGGYKARRAEAAPYFPALVVTGAMRQAIAVAFRLGEQGTIKTRTLLTSQKMPTAGAVWIGKLPGATLILRAPRRSTPSRMT
jgi:hypothetical protein